MDWSIASNILTLCISVLVLSGCSKDGEATCVQGHGDEATQIRQFNPFQKLEVAGRFNLTIIEDSVDYAQITFGSNTIDGIRTEVSSGVLSITEDNKCDFVRDVYPLTDIELHTSALWHVYCQNAGMTQFGIPFTGDSLLIEAYDVSGDLDVWVENSRTSVVVHTGATDIALRGTTTDLYLYNSGYAPIRAENLIARRASVHNNNLANTYVNAWDKVYYQIFHTGDIIVYGPADVVKWKHEGSGTILYDSL